MWLYNSQEKYNVDDGPKRIAKSWPIPGTLTTA